jgi:Arc/MetJ-type ribon-helix-helix transcriptional regulator
MNVSLTPELEKFVSGKVVREALRLLEEHDRARSAQIAAFNQELSARLAALDSGENPDPEAVREGLRRKSQERRRLSA